MLLFHDSLNQLGVIPDGTKPHSPDFFFRVPTPSNLFQPIPKGNHCETEPLPQQYLSHDAAGWDYKAFRQQLFQRSSSGPVVSHRTGTGHKGVCPQPAQPAAWFLSGPTSDGYVLSYPSAWLNSSKEIFNTAIPSKRIKYSLTHTTSSIKSNFRQL
jgi:hypothetical protein